MSDKVNNIVDYTLIATGVIVGVDNIKSIIGLIVVGIQLVWLLVKLGYKICKTIKEKGSLEDLDSDISNLVDNLKDVSDSLTDNTNTDTSEEDKDGDK